MSSPVTQWTPGLIEAIRLARKPLIAYFLFNVFGFAVLFLTISFYEGAKDMLLLFVATLAGLFGIVLGQLVALLRVRVLPIVLLGGTFLTTGALLVAAAIGSTLGAVALIGFVFFCFAFPCGMLSLQHNSEILACFWPSVGWIGSAIFILNKHAKVNDWQQDRMHVWMPIPLVYLGLFLLFMLLFLASKQTMRTELWQALSGAAERRVSKRAATLTALPRRNLLPLIVVTLLVFAFTAVLAPYLWRTGKGKDKGDGGAQRQEDTPRERRPEMDGEAFERIMRQMMQGAKSAAETLWPLLLMLIVLMILYRPLKRWLLLTHLKTPIFPAPPSERIENLWEYVRIAAGDRGAVLTTSDSVEDFVRRLPAGLEMTPALAQAADIYARTRYGFVLRPGDAQAMKVPAVRAAMEMRSGMPPWETVKSWWRELR